MTRHRPDYDKRASFFLYTDTSPGSLDMDQPVSGLTKLSSVTLVVSWIGSRR